VARSVINHIVLSAFSHPDIIATRTFNILIGIFLYNLNNLAFVYSSKSSGISEQENELLVSGKFTNAYAKPLT